jgi:hypothetical protein
MFDFELPISMETLFIGLAVVALIAGVGIWYWRYSKQSAPVPALPVQNVMKAESIATEEKEEKEDRGTPGQKTTETASKA